MSDVSLESLYLERLGRGDKDAFAALYRLYAGRCVNFALMLAKDSNAAKDITHDVFIKVWKNRDVLDRVNSFSSYLFRMMKNEVLRYFEKEQINSRYIAHKARCTEEFRNLVDEKMDMDELQLLIESAIGKMPEQRKTIFRMSRYRGLSNGEIAGTLCISIRTVEKHISNALSDIRKEIKENFV